MSYLSRAYGATKLLLKANGPSLMVAGGVGAMTFGAVLACRKTLDIENVLAEHVPMLEKINEGEALQLESYTSEVAMKDRIKVYSRVTLDLTKLYAVPGIFFVGGIALVVGGHRILLKRNATLALAFTGLKKTFDAYRARVVNQYGTEADQAFYSGYELKQVIDDETGEIKTIAARDWESAALDPYNRVFDRDSSTQWQDDLGINKMFIAQQQRLANILLNHRGYLYLSEVYEALGFPENDISRVVGWKVQKFPDGTKNVPMVDFGLDKPHPDDWKYDKARAIYLDFNCQGLIVGGKIQKILESS